MAQLALNRMKTIDKLLRQLGNIYLGDADDLSIEDAKRLRSALFSAHSQMDRVVEAAEAKLGTQQVGRAVPCTPPIANERTLSNHDGAHGVIALPTV